MTRMKKVAAILALSTLGVGSAAAADNEEPKTADAASRPNVSITLTVAKTGGEGIERSYRMVGQDGSRTSILMGWRMPIPASAKPSSDAAAEPAVVNYIYQNIGVNADMDIKIVSPGHVLLKGNIEISGARESKPRADGEKVPVLGTFSQALTIVAAENKRIRIAEAPDPDGGTLRLELEVDVLD